MAVEEVDLVFSKLTDPYNCPIEELKAEVERLNDLVGFYETKQLAIKKFINSVYGATASKYFIAYNTEMAESITAQGRDLNHFSENSVNRYFKGIFQSDPSITLYYQWVHYDENGKKFKFDSADKPDNYYVTGKWEECQSYDKAVKSGKQITAETKQYLTNNAEGHCDWFKTECKLSQKLGIDPKKMASFDISKGKTTQTPPLTGKVFDYLDGSESLTVAGDTDSLVAYATISIETNKMSIEDAFLKFKYENNDVVLKTPNGSEVVPVKNHTTQTYDIENDIVTQRPINYIMRHKVSKSKFKITSESGKEIIVTGDHSCMVIRNGALISIKAKDINKETDKLITVNI